MTYIALTPPTYQSQVELLPPNQSDLAEYNLAMQLAGPAVADLMTDTKDNSRLSEISQKEGYALFLRHLNAYSTRQQFFNEYYLPSLNIEYDPNNTQALWGQFSRQLNIQTFNTDGHLLSFTSPDSKQNAKWANEYIQVAHDAARQELVRTLQSAISIRQQVTEDQMDTLRSTAKAARKAQLKRLEDAYKLADSINLEAPPLQGNLITSFSKENLYLRGTKALEAEIQILSARQDDDAYIPELNDLLKRQSLLNTIELKPTHLKLVNIDRTAEPSTIASGPKPMMIMLLSILAGFGLSTLFVLFFSAFFPPAKKPLNPTTGPV